MIDVNDRYWPLVLYRFGGNVSLAELNEYLKRQDLMLSRQQQTGSIVLTENVRMWDAPVLRRQAEWIKQNQDLLRRYSVGVAMVIHSPIVRGMLKAILWIQPMPQPYIVCSNVEDALHWLRQRFLEAKVFVELPAKL